MTDSNITFEIESTLADGTEFTMARISGPGSFDVARILRDTLRAQGRNVYVYTVEETRGKVFAMGSAEDLFSRIRAKRA